jgi:hypothetical protein
VRKEPGCPLLDRRRLLSLISGIPLVSVGGCWSRNEPQIVDPADLDRIRAGEVVRLRELLKEPAEQVCLLTPYRDRLDETERLSHRVNAHLKAIDLTLQDGGFALVVVNGDKISVQLLSRRSDLTNWHEAAGRITKRLGCANVDRVLVTRVYDHWLVFAEER